MSSSLSDQALLKHLNDETQSTPEELRFSSQNPLRTLFVQSFGPLLYNVGNAVHDALDMYIISKALGERCLQIVGFSSIIRFLLRSFAVYFSQGAVSRVPSLIGERRQAEASQVITDLYRLTLIAMIFMPVVFVFISKPMLVFMGCTQEIAEECLSYLIPIICVSPFTGIYQMSCGFLQSEGRSVLNGMMQLSAFVINCGIFAPILLFWAKVQLNLAGLAFALSQIVPSVVLLILIFNGKFNLKPSWRQWSHKFSPETLVSLKLATSFILTILAGAFPPMVMMNFMMKAAAEVGTSSAVANGFSVFLKIQTLVNSFSQGFSQGMLASGSYANGAKKQRRMFLLFGWTILVTSLILLIFTPLMIFKPEWIASFWMSNNEELDYTKLMFKIPFFTNFLNSINDTVISLLLSATFAYSAMAPSLVRGAFYIIGACILYYTDKTNPRRMMYVYVINDLVVLFVDAIILIHPLKVMIGHMRKNESTTETMAAIKIP
ncbi:hypothetical protein TRFO_34236 [Tritrichomonas foetus]|uniref:MatE family protein n=1 Tax=Tritrichomonas foetus TaxID=1144522 RepID=A0A1J4JP90_9EUKA|nr:hypothetical protein TRFO_34236 [Tritrichomonas foetus]|eukprot:OHS99331.1 hypothetical protein TRFO_34236 [Tritrichomonas foetus]